MTGGGPNVASSDDQPGSFGGTGIGPPSPALNFGADPAAQPGVYTSGGAGGDWSSGSGGLFGGLNITPDMLYKGLISGAPLLMNLMRGNEQYPAEKQLQGLATNASTQGQALSGYINSGTLPPGAQANVDAATKAGEAKIRTTNARMGLSGSTMEAQQLAGVRQQAAGQQFDIAESLLKQGTEYSKLGGALTAELLKTQAGTDQEFQRALLAFAGGLGGLRGGGA
jgi:hypothetical protein